MTAPQRNGEPAAPVRRPQMADVARIAGVSVATVSRALSDSPLINAKTKARIHAIVRDLNYSVNVAAKNLRQRTNRTVAFVIPFEAGSRQAISDPFLLNILGNVVDALTERQFELLVSRVDASNLNHIAELYQTGRVCGVILIGQWHQHKELNDLAALGVPLVVWGGALPGQSYSTVGGDNLKGGRDATERLLARGARRIAFLGDVELPEVGLRYAGYVDAHRAHGLRVPRSLVFQIPFAAHLAQARIDAILNSKPRFDAVFATSDLLAMLTITALRRIGLQVPADVLVVGYDDVPLAGTFNPPLTTVSQHIDQAGRMMVETLLEVMEGRGKLSTLMPTDLVVRDSA